MVFLLSRILIIIIINVELICQLLMELIKFMIGYF